jgi:long-chain fatty acid transport protein
MKRWLISSGITIVLFSSASLTLAKGIFIRPGTRANTLGGAYIGIADDLTAIYWNPAGLEQLDGSGVEMSAFYAAAKGKSNSSLMNAVAPDAEDGDFPIFNLYAILGQPNAEPTEYQSKEFKTGALLPFVAGHTKVKGITLALGFYAIGGGGGKWEDSVKGFLVPTDDIISSIDGSYGFTVGNISAAKEINPKLSLGLGVNWIYMTDELEIKKEYQKSAGSPLGNYSALVDKNASGSGMEVMGGVLYKLTEKLKAGFVIRSGATLKLKGKAKTKITGLSALSGGLMPDVDHETDYDQNYAYPLTYGLGASYELMDSLTLALGAEMINYSAMKDNIDYEDELAGTLEDVNEKKEWKDTTRVYLGAEYRINEKLSFQSGLQTNPVPCPKDKLTLLNTQQYNLTSLSLGARYKMRVSQIDVGYIHSFSDNPEKEGREYKYPSDSYRLGVGYKF